MIAILSPAKNIRFAARPDLALTVPMFREQTETLLEQLRGYQPYELESLLKVNPKIALRAFQDFQDFQFGKGSAAILSYYGLAYQNLNASDFSLEDFSFASKHLRILSAFYGLLRPMDAISPYRLELQSKVKVQGKSLYAFWQDRLCSALFSEDPFVINLASGEYAKAIFPYLRPGNQWISCDFVTLRRGRRITLATEAKMARGQMARAIVKNRWNQPQDLRQFYWEGYEFCEELSSGQRFVFFRP